MFKVWTRKKNNSWDKNVGQILSYLEEEKTVIILQILHVYLFLLFEQNTIQTTILFLFKLVDNILQTSSVAEKSTDALAQEDMAVSDKFRWCPTMMPHSDDHRW